MEGKQGFIEQGADDGSDRTNRRQGWGGRGEVGGDGGGGGRRRESMQNYSATATQVVTCARRFLQRFNPALRDSIWPFYSLLGAVAMGLCMWSRAR